MEFALCRRAADGSSNFPILVRFVSDADYIISLHHSLSEAKETMENPRASIHDGRVHWAGSYSCDGYRSYARLAYAC